ncbi:MAG TPA: hypothetical protein VM431_01550 [Phycisphaerae bacterium]|nr:hypothetical protein [Phycisphaerae bacterium]
MAQMKLLSEVVMDALALHAEQKPPELKRGGGRRPIVVGSGNAYETGRIIFRDADAVFADEGQYPLALERTPTIDEAVVLSASGGKHAPGIVKDLLGRGLDTFLVTCNGESDAARLLDEAHVTVTRSLPEPITYNTSTYLGMILAKTQEDPARIREHIENEVEPRLGDMTAFSAFYLLVEPRYDVQRGMFITKFDELFGPRVNGRCYTTEQTVHAKTVVPWEKELFISFGYENRIFGHASARLNVPLFDDAGDAAVVAIGYYVVGRIQQQFPPFFMENADRYKALQPQLFQQLHDPAR